MKFIAIELVPLIVVLVLIFWAIPAAIKYFIRYGIDYYLSKVGGQSNDIKKE